MLKQYRVDDQRTMRDAFVGNACYGGFSLSVAAQQRYLDIIGRPHYVDENNYVMFDDGSGSCFCEHKLDRRDPVLLQVVKEMGCQAASGPCAALIVAKDCIFHPKACGIESEYDGIEYWPSRCRFCAKPEIYGHQKNKPAHPQKYPRSNSV